MGPIKRRALAGPSVEASFVWKRCSTAPNSLWAAWNYLYRGHEFSIAASHQVFTIVISVGKDRVTGFVNKLEEPVNISV